MHLLVLCFLADPMLPPASVQNTGGYDADIAELLDNLQNRDGLEVSVITNTNPYFKSAADWYCDDIVIHRIPIDDSHLTRQELLAADAEALVDETCRIIDGLPTSPDVIHSLYWVSGWVASRIFDIRRIPFVHSVVSLSAQKTMSGVEARSPVQRAWEDNFLHKASAIMAITPSEREVLCSQYGIPRGKVVIVGRGIHKAFSIPFRDVWGTPQSLGGNSNLEELVNAEDDRLRLLEERWWIGGAFLYMGRMKEIKGIPTIVRAWLMLHKIHGDSTPPLWLAGGTPEAIQKMRESILPESPQLLEMERSNRIIWWGYLPAEGLATLLAKTSALIMHSRFEAGGRILLEAMSAGKAVIATRTGFGADYVRNWENGFTVEFGDERALAHRMAHFVKQPLLGNVLGFSGKQCIDMLERQWNCYGTHLDVYRAALSGRRTTIQQDLSSELHDHFEYGDLVMCGVDRDCFLKCQIRDFLVACDIIPKSLNEIQANTWNVSSEKGEFTVLRAVTRLNKAALWRGCGQKMTIPATEQMCSMLRCAEQYPGSLEVIELDSATGLVLTDKVEPVLSKEVFSALVDRMPGIKSLRAPELIRLRDAGIKTTCYGDLLAEAMKFADDDAIGIWRSNWSRYLAKLAETSPSHETPCWCYGQQFEGNCGYDSRGRIALVPSRTCFFGPQELDAALLLTETWMANLVSLSQGFDLVCSRLQYRADEFAAWCILAFALKSMKSFTLDCTVRFTDNMCSALEYLASCLTI